MKSVNFGIDLGTTNSLIAKFENGKVKVFKNPVGFKETLPSVVAFRNDKVMVGDKAREYILKDPLNVFGSFKRKMGTDEKYYVLNLDENVTPIELSSYVLKELKHFVLDEEKPQAAVVTIPASFNSMQSNATLKAAKEAGFAEVYLLQEPIAASLAYFNQNGNTDLPNGNWLVYDLGGGTFDVALVKSTDNEIKIVDNEGNNFLGGVDFDALILEKIIVPEVERSTGVNNFDRLLKEKNSPLEKLYYQLMYQVEEAKKELSTSASTEIEFSVTLDDQAYEFNLNITQRQLNEILLPKVNETISFISQLLKNNNLQSSSISQIILVGGSTYLPIVREQLQLQTGIAVNTTIDPTTAIVVGAAYYAANKYFKPDQIEEKKLADVDALINTAFTTDDAALKVHLVYNSSCKDNEEVLLMQCQGDATEYFYRIRRSDGGFDTGLVQLKNRKSEFLTLLPGINNTFDFRVFDKQQNELPYLAQQINIQQGKYVIDGQPLPNDISIEVDDVENRMTKLEVIFERNSLLPQKRTIYREISKTIKKGSDDKIVINILEGNRNARPSSNLCIGCIEICGKDIDFDLAKGSDIEIQVQMSESRILNTQVYLAMIKQEFKHVFSISEKVISLSRLQEQCQQLESELRENLIEFQYNEDKLLEIQIEELLGQVRACNSELLNIKEKDRGDKKYVIAEKLWHISQQADKLGGSERINTLIERYFYGKDDVHAVIMQIDLDNQKEKVMQMFQNVIKNEASLIQSKNISVIENAIRKLEDVYNIANSYNAAHLVTIYNEYCSLPDSEYKQPKMARSFLEKAEKAIQKENFSELRNHLVAVYNLTYRFEMGKDRSNFSGTGIG